MMGVKKTQGKSSIAPRRVDTSEAGVRERAWRNAALAAREAIELTAKAETASDPLKPTLRSSAEHKWVLAVVSLLTALSD
jgi:ethanolamine utilization protein EutP (predicted NTPase)